MITVSPNKTLRSLISVKLRGVVSSNEMHRVQKNNKLCRFYWREPGISPIRAPVGENPIAVETALAAVLTTLARAGT